MHITTYEAVGVREACSYCFIDFSQMANESYCSYLRGQATNFDVTSHDHAVITQKDVLKVTKLSYYNS